MGQPSIPARYTLVRPLGEGGMGAVFLVEDRWDGNRLLALKKIRPERLSDLTRQQLAREFTALKQLRHPHLSGVHDFGFTQAGEPYFTSEYCPGQNLIAATKAMSFSERAAIAVEICRALSYIHARGYIHGDLKPENILVLDDRKTGTSSVKILDFGLAWHRSESKQDRLGGTLAYIAPEVLKGRPPNHTADFYALGVLLYQLFARQLPFGDIEPPLLIDMQLSVSPSPPSGKDRALPSALDSILLRLLEKEPQNRFQSSDEIIHAFNDHLGFHFEIETPATAKDYVRSSAFVGREKEFSRLQELLSQIQDSGGGRLILVGGESGVGKTRILEELKNQAQLEGVRTFSGAAYERIQQPFQCFLDVLRPMVMTAAESLSPEGSLLKKFEAPLSQLLPSLFGAASFSSEHIPPSGSEKELLLESLTWFISECTSTQPTLILIQDFHWADALSLELLLRMARTLSEQKMLVCISYRTDEIVGTAFENVLPQLTEMAATECLLLKPFNREEVRELVGSMLGLPQVPTAVTERVYEETRGNPFFIQEVLWTWISENIVTPRMEEWNISPEAFSAVQIPSTMNEAFLRRLRCLPARSQDVLQTMAFLNEPLPCNAVARVVGREEEVIESTLDALVESAILARMDAPEAPRYYFRHIQMKNSIEVGVPAARAQSMHEKIAHYYEDLSASTPTDHSEALAYHYAMSGEQEKARVYSIRAGDKLRKLFSYGDAIAAYCQAEQLSPIKDERLFELREKIAFCHYQLGELHPAEEIYQSLVKEGGAHLTPGRTAKLRLRLGMIAEYRGQYHEAIELNMSSYRLVESLPEPRTKADLLARIGFEHQRLSHYRVALEYVEKALTLVEHLENYFGLGDIYNNQFIIHYYLGEYAQALDAGHRAIAVYTKFGWMKGMAGVTANLGAIYEDYLHDYRRALEYQRRALHLREKIFDRRGIEQSYINLSSIHSKLGELSTSLDYVERAEQLNRTLPEKHIEMQIAHNRGENLTRLGTLHGARQSLDQAMALAEESHNQQIKISILNRLAEWHEKLGEWPAARERARAGVELAVKMESKLEELSARITLARILIESEHWEEVQDSLLRALSLAEQLNHRDWQLQALLLRAQADLERKRPDGCQATLTHSQPLAEKTQNPLLKARFHLLRGQLALERTDPYQHSGAEDLHQAVRLAETTEEFELIAGARYKLGQWYRKQGDSLNAQECFQQARTVLLEVANRLPEELQKKYLENRFRASILNADIADMGETKDTQMFGEKPTASVVNRQNYSVTLFQISKIINSIVHLNELLEQVMDLVLEAIRVERGLILLVNEDTGALEVKVARNIGRATIEDATAISQSVLEDVMHGGKPLISVNAKDDQRLRDRASIVDFGIGMVLCIPLNVKQKVIGAVYIDNPIATLPFNEEDVNFLMSFTNVFAIAIENARLYERLHQENLYLRQEVRGKYAYDNIIGRSPRMMELFRRLDNVVNSAANVLVIGESGTGKELIARAIHYNGGRKDKRFVAIDCGAIPENLIESELFGYKKGAFTGALTDRRGLFEEADGGTIFLDEITNTSKTLQAKLLRAIQEREIRRVGETLDRKVDVRIIAATNRDLKPLITSGEFREDLYYRLNVLNLHIPPLRERKEDIPLLVNQILKRLSERNPSLQRRISKAALHMLSQYHFPGNVRQLENTVESAFYMSKEVEIQVEDFPDEILWVWSQAKSKASATSASAANMLAAAKVEQETVEGNKEQVATALQLFNTMKEEGKSFWVIVKDPYMRREIPKEVVRTVIRLGLKETRGRYKELAKLFNLESSGYTVFMNFLRKHECQVDYKPFRLSRPS